ncbi:MAG: alpha/beta hydrolase-fold protein [Lachnospiraceae bacterium]|nr:alpha/beta hydrolase-fold protein [Lachnospiraceae bacterium]
MAQLHCNFFSYSLGYGVDFTLLLPSFSPCDMDRKDGRTHAIPGKYPILYLLHGHGNDYMSWNRFTCIERYAEERRIAVVTFSVGNKGYMNAAYGENYYDFVEKELPEFLKANFPISDRPEDTYIAGASMGGYGALAHAFGHPESYRAVGAFSPATAWRHDPSYNEATVDRLGHEMPEMMDLYETLDQDLKDGKKLPDIFCCMGERDFLLESGERFRQYLEEKQVAHRYDLLPEYEHEWAIWEKELPEFLDWLPRTDLYAGMEKHKM